MLDVINAYVRNRTMVTAVLTALSVVAAAFGFVVPAVPEWLPTVVLALLTGVFGVNAEQAAYIDGLFDEIDDLFDGEPAQPQAP